MASASSHEVEVEGLRLHYLEAGEGDPVLLLHGWPTSSFLWRNLIPILAEGNRVIAPDLPGFGRSDKPLDASYSFGFYNRVLDGFLSAVGVSRLHGLAVHDIGGPIGLHWASAALGSGRAARAAQHARLPAAVLGRGGLRRGAADPRAEVVPDQPAGAAARDADGCT